MKYNFDDGVNRLETRDIKWKPCKDDKGEYSIVPMWVADMDLATAKPIQEAIIKRANVCAYGYSAIDEDITNDVVAYLNRQHNYNAKPEEILYSTGVVYSIGEIIRLFTKPQDGIMIMKPAYHPFVSQTIDNDRVPYYTYLKQEGNAWFVDFDEMEKIIDDKCKAIIVCNPQNPTGKLFSLDELKKISAFAKKHNLLIISDEIHCDFDYENKFIPMNSVDEYASKNTISLLSITKTFNLAGLKVSFAVVKNKELRTKLKQAFARDGIDAINTFGIEALDTAVTTCDDWLEQAKAYIYDNLKYVKEQFDKTNGKVKCHVPEGTYLIWLDMRESGIELEKLDDTCLNQGKVKFNAGSFFGEEYVGWERMNVACPRAQVKQAVDNIMKMLEE